MDTQDPIKHFLLVFDHKQGRLIDLVQFDEDSEAALSAYAQREQETAIRDRVEIVLIGSDSLDTVKLTHGNYFDGSAATRHSKYLSGLLRAV